MSVNGITGISNAYSAYETATTAAGKTTAESKAAESASSGQEQGAVYEPSGQTADSVKKTYSPDTAVIEKLKADAEQRASQLKSLVEKLMYGQGNAIGTADNLWSFLRTGAFTVDAGTKAQAQADIAEDGYWGVEQTSDRIVDFAMALTGGDPDKIEEMREAFQKGFEQATKAWGDELPEISQRTYEATMEKFDAWAAEAQGQATQIV